VARVQAEKLGSGELAFLPTYVQAARILVAMSSMRHSGTVPLRTAMVRLAPEVRCQYSSSKNVIRRHTPEAVPAVEAFITGLDMLSVWLHERDAL